MNCSQTFARVPEGSEQLLSLEMPTIANLKSKGSRSYVFLFCQSSVLLIYGSLLYDAHGTRRWFERCHPSPPSSSKARYHHGLTRRSVVS